jgi:hypothetical protein
MIWGRNCPGTGRTNLANHRCCVSFDEIVGKRDRKGVGPSNGVGTPTSRFRTQRRGVAPGYGKNAPEPCRLRTECPRVNQMALVGFCFAMSMLVAQPSCISSELRNPNRLCPIPAQMFPRVLSASYVITTKKIKMKGSNGHGTCRVQGNLGGLVVGWELERGGIEAGQDTQSWVIFARARGDMLACNGQSAM